ncbi:alpha/beta hydrolase [Vulgatibacter incomptus]|uniref:Hydrolase n=1 Tax=Vulgatibacter incomptus TaxID=1391653 RepID=A0A0K1PBS5_9BACT|nr:alpha/beta fold hydrolase [Vulgatibacter incomptus]AKU90856.1 Hydrolase [Vulgatibacter incomptus]
MHRAIQATFRTLTPVPSLASMLAARLWMIPPRAPIRPEQEAWLAKAERRDVDAGGTKVATYAWGRGPAVLLMHGWGGHAGQLTGFVPGLVEAGHRVVAYDGPRHGATQGGTPSLLSFSESAQAVAGREGGLSAVIAHSMGASAAAFSMSRGLEADRAVFLAPAATMSGAAERFAKMVRLDPRALEQMRRRFERELNIPWEELDVVRSAHQMRSALLVIHDESDRDVPFSDGDAIARAWPTGSLVTTTGLGHHRLLRDADVVRRTIDFVSAGRP